MELLPITSITRLQKPGWFSKQNTEALVSLYSGPFGFAAFYDAAQQRMLNGTAPLLRTQQEGRGLQQALAVLQILRELRMVEVS